MKNKHKYILFFIGISILYICLIQFVHARVYTYVQNEQFSSDMIFLIDMLFYFLLCMPAIIFLFRLLKRNGLKDMLLQSGIPVRKHCLGFLLYFFMLYMIARNCFSGYWTFSFFGKEVLFSENQTSLLTFCYYLFDDYFTLCVLGITPLIVYISTKFKSIQFI